MKGIAHEPKDKKNKHEKEDKYKLENVDVKVIRESLRALKSILDRDLIPYSFLTSKTTYPKRILVDCRIFAHRC